MDKESSSPSSTEGLLKGKTLKIYWYLLTKECGIREIQRDLNFTSPSIVSYHITKLVDSGLVSKENDKYRVIDTVKTGIVGLYVKFGRIMIPRMLFYISFLVVGLLLYINLIFSRSTIYFYSEDILFLVFIFGSILFFIFETLKIRSIKPS